MPVYYPSPLTDPITELLGSTLSTIAAVLFLGTAAITAVIAGNLTRQAAALRAVTVGAILSAVVIGLIAIALAGSPEKRMSADGAVDILSAAGVYGALIWGGGLFIAKALSD